MDVQELKTLSHHLIRGRKDIVYFAWYFLGLTLHPGQIAFLRGATANVNLLVPGNRWGKTVAIAVRHVWHNFYKIGVAEGDAEEWKRAYYRTVALAPLSEILDTDFKIIKDILMGNFVVSKDDEPIKTNQCRINWYVEWDKCRNSAPFFIQFKDNSGIKFSTTGDNKGSGVQGQKFGYGSYDEGGRSYHLEYELKSNLIPRFGEMGAQLDIPSTPDQASPSLLYHYEIFKLGLEEKEGFKSFEGSAFENVFLPESYFKQVKESLGNDPIINQVLYGKFVFAGDNLFPAGDIAEAQDESLNDGERYELKHNYIIGIDTAMGEDEMVYTVLDVTDEEHIRLVRQIGAKGNSKSPQLHMLDLMDLYDAYNQAKNVKIILETWNGESARFYMDLPREMQTVTKCFGSWQPPGITSKMIGRNPRNVRKAEILIALRKLLANKKLKIPIESNLIKQLSIYREEDNKLPTDRVMSLALACWLATDGRPKVTKIEMIEAVGW